MISDHNSMVWIVYVMDCGQMENRHRQYLPIKKILDGSGLAMRPWQSTDLWERMKNSSNNREMTVVRILRWILI